MININMQFENLDEAREVFGVLALLGHTPETGKVAVAGPVSIPEPEPETVATAPETAATVDEGEDEGGGADDGNVMAYKPALELAERHGVDLTEVTGTGKGGKITKTNVQEVIDARASTAREEKVAVQERPLQEPASPSSPGPGADTKRLTIEDCREALSELAKATNFNTCAKVLNEFSAARLSDLSEDRYLPFVKACSEAAKGKS